MTMSQALKRSSILGAALFICLTTIAASPDKPEAMNMPLDPSAHQRAATIHEVTTSLYSSHRAVFSPDGSRAAVLGYSDLGRKQPIVEIYDTASWKQVARRALSLSRTDYTAGGLAFSPDGRLLAAGAGSVVVWRTDTWQEVFVSNGPFSRGPYAAHNLSAIAFSTDSKTLAALYDRVWFPETLRVDTTDQLVALEAARRNSILANEKPAEFTAPLVAFLDASTGQPLGQACPGGCDGNSRAMVSSVLLGTGQGFLVPYAEPAGSPSVGPMRISLTLGAISPKGPGQATPIPNKAPITAAAAWGNTVVAGSMPNDLFAGGKDQQPLTVFHADGRALSSIQTFGAIRSIGIAASSDQLTTFSTAPFRDAAVEVWDLKSNQLIQRATIDGLKSDFGASAVDPLRGRALVATLRAREHDKLLIADIHKVQPSHHQVSWRFSTSTVAQAAAMIAAACNNNAPIGRGAVLWQSSPNLRRLRR